MIHLASVQGTKPLISIIIPTYNAGRFLERCLDSVLQQTFNHLQVICVDDGSGDNTRDILGHFQSKDKRVQVFRQEHLGASAARNLGLSKAAGEFLMFIDSDDWIESNTCELALEAMTRHNSDMVMWPYIREFGDVSRRKIIFEDDEIVFAAENIRETVCRRMFGLLGDEMAHPDKADALNLVTTKLYRRSIVENTGIRFIDIDLIGTSEDALFNMMFLMGGAKAVYINHYLYHYNRINAQSLTSLHRPRLEFQWDHLYTMMQGLIETEKFPQSCEVALANRKALGVVYLVLNILFEQETPLIKLRKVRKFLRDEKIQQLVRTFEVQFLPLSWKLFFASVRAKCTVCACLLVWVGASLRRQF